MKRQQALLAAIVSGLLAATAHAQSGAPVQQEGIPAQGAPKKNKAGKDKSAKNKSHKANKGKAVGKDKEPNSCGGAGGERK